MSSACTSSSQGIGYGFETIRENRADIMVCGGAEEFCPSMAIVFDRLYATSAAANENPAEASKPFDGARDGMVTGEGAGFLILEEREHAQIAAREQAFQRDFPARYEVFDQEMVEIGLSRRLKLRRFQ